MVRGFLWKSKDRQSWEQEELASPDLFQAVTSAKIAALINGQWVLVTAPENSEAVLVFQGGTQTLTVASALAWREAR